MRRRWLDALAVAILLAALAARLVHLDAFIAADELRWVCRSLSFGQALAAGDFPHTFLTGHPGVVTMWLGTLAVPPNQASASVLATCRATENGESPTGADAPQLAGLAATLFRMRIAAALFNSLLLAVAYGLTRRLVGAWPALVGLTLLAFDPFLLAHSRVLHLDAIVSGLMLCSALLLLQAFSGQQSAVSGQPPVTTRSSLIVHRSSLFLSGLIAGVALAQKVAAVFLWPWAGLALLALAWRGTGFAWRPRRGQPSLGIVSGPPAHAPATATPPRAAWTALLTGLLRLGLTWGLALVVGVLLVWPAAWSNPVGTAQGVVAKAAVEGGNPHQAGQVLGEEVVEDPGPLMYALALVFRASPWMLIGLVVSGWWVVRRWGGGGGWWVVVALLGLAVLFGLLISLSPKKFDRYLLPAFPPLDLAAGIALAALASRLGNREDGLRNTEYALRNTKYEIRLLRPLAIALLLLTQLLLVLPHAPYYLTYYNPLLGGGEGATHWLLVGWGEGYDLAAAYLNRLPNAADTQVAVRGVSQFAPLFVGDTRSAPGYRPYQTDYVVLYSNEVQRRRSEGLMARYLDNPAEKPVYVARLHGIDYAWVYANTTATQPLADLAARRQPGDVVVVNGASLAAKGLPVGQAAVRVYGHFGAAETAEALAGLTPGARLWYLRYPDADPGVVLDTLREQAILEPEPRRYPDVELWSGRVAPQPRTPLGLAVAGLRLTAWSPSQYALTPGTPEALSLAWEVQQPPAADLTLALDLFDTSGMLVTRTEKRLLSRDLRPTSRWIQGEQVITLVPFTVPLGTPPGGLTPVLRVRRGTEWLTLSGQSSVRLDPLTVGRAAQVAQPDSPVRLDRDVGQGLRLVGHGLTPQKARPGDFIEVPLWWRVVGPVSPTRIELLARDAAGRASTAQARVLISPEQSNSDWRSGDVYRVLSRVALPDMTRGPAAVELQLHRLDGPSTLVTRLDLGQVWVDGPPTLDLPRPPGQNADFRVGDSARLVGYDAPPAKPGEPLTLTLYWRAAGPAPMDYSVFVHLLRPDGGILTQVDRTPGLGQYPTTAWRAGEVVVDPYPLDVPADTPPGRYQVAVGWYTGQGRAPVRDAQGRPQPDDRILLDVEVR